MGRNSALSPPQSYLKLSESVRIESVMTDKELNTAKDLFRYIREDWQIGKDVNEFSPPLADALDDFKPKTELTDILLNLMGVPKDTTCEPLEEWEKTGNKPADLGFCRDWFIDAIWGELEDIDTFDDFLAMCNEVAE